MFGPVGWHEILLILVLALLVFGPRRLPELGRTLGRALGEFRRATTDLKRTLNAEIALEEGERSRSPRRPELAASSAEPAEPSEPSDPDGGPHREPARPPAATMPRGAEALDLAGVVDDGEEERAPRPPAPSTGSGESSGGGAASPDAEAAGSSSAAEASDAGEAASDAAPDDSHRRDAPATTH
jgi:sec-independent protein translocase protein TatB